MHTAYLRQYHSSQSLQPLARYRFFMTDRNTSFCVSHILRFLLQNDSRNTFKARLRTTANWNGCYILHLAKPANAEPYSISLSKQNCLPLESHPLANFILELSALIVHIQAISKICLRQTYTWDLHTQTHQHPYQFEVYSLF